MSFFLVSLALAILVGTLRHRALVRSGRPSLVARGAGDACPGAALSHGSVWAGEVA